MSAVTNDPNLINAAVAQYISSDDRTEEPEPTEFYPAQDRTVTLPGGIITPTGDVVTEISVRELTGRDEEAISKCRTIGKVLLTVLERGISSIGSRRPSESDLNSMLAGDRDVALLNIYSVTFGSEVQATRMCAACNEAATLTIDLDSDIPIKKLGSPQERYFTVRTSRGDARVELPNGYTQKALFESSDKSLAELSTLLLVNTVSDIGDNPVMGPRQVQDLSIKDRRKIAEEIGSRNPGPQMSGIKKDCTNCGAEMEVAISIAGLFQS